MRSVYTAAAAVGLCAVSPAQAALIIVDVAGTANPVNLAGYPNGTAITGQILLETTAAPTQTGSNANGPYAYYRASTVSLLVDGRPVTLNSRSSTGVFSGAAAGVQFWGSGTAIAGTGAGGVDPRYLAIYFQTPGMTQGTALPQTADAFLSKSATFSLYFDQSFSRYLQGTLRVVSATAVPEPASWATMIGGFALVGGAMRRPRRARTA